MVYTIEINKAKVENQPTSWKDKYLAYCDSQMKDPLVWYLIPLIIFSAVVIPIITLVLYLLGLPYIWVMSFSVLLFYANIIVNIGGYNTRITITTFLVTTLIMILIPIMSYILLG